MEIPSRQTEIILRRGNQSERIEKQGKAILRGVENCKDMYKIFETLIGNHYKKGNTELEFYTRGLYEKFKQFYPKEENNDTIKIELKDFKKEREHKLGEQYGKDFTLVETPKDSKLILKETIVKYEDVNFLSNLLKDLKINQKISYRELVNEIIEIKNLNISIDAFNGGKNRAKSYFEFYYYPVKVLEELGVIEYSKRGVITRLK